MALAGLALFLFVQTGSAKASPCVYPKPGSPERLSLYLQNIVHKSGGPRGADIDIALSRNRVKIRIKEGRGTFSIGWRLSKKCRPSSLTSQFPEKVLPWMKAIDPKKLMAGFPLKPVMAGDDIEFSLSSGPLDLWWVTLLIIAFWLGVKRTSSRAGLHRAVILVSVSALLVVAAWPIFSAPIANLASQVRLLLSLDNPFGDRGHPFLFFLLEKPFVHLSTELWVLRLMPFLILLTETILLCLVAYRASGALGALLAGLWFVCEVPRRHGFFDLSDWDLAGAILLGQLWWIQSCLGNRGIPTGRAQWGLLLLVIGGICASWMMAVPALAILVLLAWHWRRRKELYLPMILLLAAVSAAIVWMVATVSSSQFPAPPQAAALLLGMVHELPAGRTLWMVIPLAMGLSWLLARPVERTRMFILAVTGGVITAILASRVLFQAASGYYLGLITPLVIFSSALAFHNGAEWLWRIVKKNNTLRLWRQKLHFGLAILGLAGLSAMLMGTVQFPAKRIYDSVKWAEKMPLLVSLVREKPLEILTNDDQFRSYLRFEQGRALGDLGMVKKLKSPPVFFLPARACHDQPLARANPQHYTPVFKHSVKGRQCYLVLMQLSGRQREQCMRANNMACSEVLNSRGSNSARSDMNVYRCSGL